MMRKVACYMVLMLAFVGTMRAEEVGQEWAAPVRASALVAIEGLENDTTQREQIGLFWQDNRLCVQRYNAPNAVLATAQVAGDTLFVMEHPLYAVNKAANYMYSVDLAPRDFMAVKLNGESVFPVMNWDSARVYEVHPIMDQEMAEYIVDSWYLVEQPNEAYIDSVDGMPNWKSTDDWYDTTKMLYVYADYTWKYYNRDTLLDCGRFILRDVKYPYFVCLDCHCNTVFMQDTALFSGRIYKDLSRWRTMGRDAHQFIEGEYYDCNRDIAYSPATKDNFIDGYALFVSTTQKLPESVRNMLFTIREYKKGKCEQRKVQFILLSPSIWQSMIPEYNNY